MISLDPQTSVETVAHAQREPGLHPMTRSQPRDRGSAFPPLFGGQRAQQVGDGAAGALEVAIGRVAVTLALWLGY